MATPSKDLLLVGSIPLNTVQDVFETCADIVGDHTPYIPDGEVGDRIWWVNYLAYRIFNGHPDIETLRRPAPIDGYPQWKPTGLGNIWEFTLKPGTQALRFLDLDYATAAHNSYGIFCLLREAGKIPAGVKFLVCLPLTNSASDWILPQSGRLPSGT